jgi:hypothetical protein
VAKLIGITRNHSADAPLNQLRAWRPMSDREREPGSREKTKS